MKKKIIIAIISSISILAVGVGGFVLGSSSKTSEPPIVIEKGVKDEMIQLLYGCPNSKKKKNKGV